MSNSLHNNNSEVLISEADMVYSSLKASFYPTSPLSSHYNLFDCHADFNATHFEPERVTSEPPTQAHQTQQHVFYQNSPNANSAYVMGESNGKEQPRAIEPLPQLSVSTIFNLLPSSPIFASNITPTFSNYDPHIQMKSFLDVEREMSSTGLSRSNSQPDLTEKKAVMTQMAHVRRHPSLSYKTSMSECSEEFFVDFNEASTTTTTTDDGIFLGTDAISDFLSAGGTFSDIFDDMPDLEGLMSLVTFEPKMSQCDFNLDDFSAMSNVSAERSSEESRTTRSAPPSPTQARKKRTSSWPSNKAWSKMSSEEHISAVECLTRIINDEMGLREQLEIIRIISPDKKLLPSDTQFVMDLNMINDEKFRRIKEIIKFHGLNLNEKQNGDNFSECSANSCPQGYKLAKRELRLRRAQQRLIKHTQRKETRQILKESKSGLFTKTEVIPLSQVLPEEDIEVDILS